MSNILFMQKSNKKQVTFVYNSVKFYYTIHIVEKKRIAKTCWNEICGHFVFDKLRLAFMIHLFIFFVFVIFSGNYIYA